MSSKAPVEQHERTLCKLSLGDDAFIEAALAGDGANKAASELDAKAHALVRLGALIALNASSPSYMSAIERARRAGASEDEIVGTLIAVMPRPPELARPPVFDFVLPAEPSAEPHVVRSRAPAYTVRA